MSAVRHVSEMGLCLQLREGPRHIEERDDDFIGDLDLESPFAGLKKELVSYIGRRQHVNCGERARLLSVDHHCRARLGRAD